MKRILLFFLWLYKIIVSPPLHILTGGSGCRYEITCSEYARKAIRTHGALRGSLLAIKRLSTCHPFARVTSYQV